MEFINQTVPKDFNLFLTGDMHIGNNLCHENGIRRMITAIEKPYKGVKSNFVVVMGDQIESIRPDDFRFSLRNVDLKKPRIEQQAEFFIEIMKPIRNKIVTILEGNHEEKATKQAFDMAEYMCRELGVKYGTYTSIVNFSDKKLNTFFKGFFTHGNGGITSTADAPERQMANMRISLKRKLYPLAGDCALMAMGHTHKLIVAKPESKLYLTSNGEETKQNYTKPQQNGEFIPKDMRWYVNTGSFLRLYGKGFSGYAERAMYAPVELGYAVVRVRGGIIEGIDRIIV